MLKSLEIVLKDSHLLKIIERKNHDIKQAGDWRMFKLVIVISKYVNYYKDNHQVKGIQQTYFVSG